MYSTKSRRLRMLLLALALVLGLVSTAVLFSGCGEKTTEQAIEQAIEEAAGANGENVNVDINTDEGKVSVSGDNGATSWQTGESVDLPEGFPKGLVPDGAKIVTAVTADNGQTIIFTSSKGPADMYAFYLEALPAAGFSIVNKMQIEGQGETTIAVMAESADTSVSAAGGSKTDEAYTYQVVITPKS
jgi:type II secretory pathway pseudopilin PulG